MFKKIIVFLIALLFIITALPTIGSKNIENVKKIHDTQNFHMHEVEFYLGSIKNISEVFYYGDLCYKFDVIYVRYLSIVFWLYIIPICMRGYLENRVFALSKANFTGIIKEGFICGVYHDIVNFPRSNNVT